MMGFKRTYINDAIKFVRAFEVKKQVLSLQYAQGRLYLADLQNIACTDSVGNVLRVYGRQGKGPGEFLQIDGHVINKEGICILDPINLRATEFNHEGVMTHLFDFSTSFRRGVPINTNKFLLQPKQGGTATEEEFEVLDISTKQTQSIKTPRFQESAQSVFFARNMELDGMLINNGNGTIFRISFMTGEFVAFDSEGKVKYRKKTIDQTPVATVMTKGEGKNMGAMYDMEKTRLVNVSSTADSRYLYISSNAQSPEIAHKNNLNSESVVDIYRIDTGDYVCSIKIPKYNDPQYAGALEFPPIIAIAPVGIYVYQGMNICYYSLDLSKVKA